MRQVFRLGLAAGAAWGVQAWSGDCPPAPDCDEADKIDGCCPQAATVPPPARTTVTPPRPRTTTPKPPAAPATARIEEHGGIRMAWIPAGNFLMGSPASDAEAEDDEKPQHRVEISAGFWLMETEVTQGLWQNLMGSNPSQFAACGEKCPVESVRLCDAVLFANALSAREGLKAAYNYPANFAKGMDYDTCNAQAGQVRWDRAADGYRLPTEAEWEYAARAGTQTRYWAGDSEADLARTGWYNGNARRTTHPVGQKAANAWGVRDVHGNVWEWVFDTYDSQAYSQSSELDPLFIGGDPRVIRGGSWLNNSRSARAADRIKITPGSNNGSVGFRLARSAAAPSGR